ncbi:aldehyde dehydrogenase family protein [Acuticoccus yangtzensis]|uniref:aldehyde dehydrogenase family protein n=1 Tax=Acuticoccus yangtzensis TaxID=1443441 RepID=UPI000AB846FA|nr:aldehyde dehydrogenase family protein [Acuticoccus yangtzensis]
MSVRLTPFVGAADVPADGPSTTLVRPSDGAVIGELVEAGASGVDAAVAAAKATFLAHRRATVADRAGWLRAAAAALNADADAIADLISDDIGKPIRAAKFEAGRGGAFLEATANALTQMGGETLPVDAVPNGRAHFGFTRRVPFGVVGAITPFNAPINLLVQKVAPALAAGNAVVVKPAPGGTRAALRAARAFVAAGVPAGLFNVVTGDRETALALAAHEDVAMVSFTGATAAGEAIARAAGAKKFAAELGSNAANLVFADADVGAAAAKIAGAAFEASGQQCISAQRILVERPVFDAFAEKFVAAAHRLKVGDAADPATDVGPMVHAAAADRVMAMAEGAVAAGARALMMPERTGCIVSPGIFAEVPATAALWRDEVFGPLALLAPFDTLDEAIAMANDSPFGLQGAAFTASLATAMRLSEEFEVGSLWINEASRFRLDMYPFGGMKKSGVGREGVRYAIEEMSQVRFTGFAL